MDYTTPELMAAVMARLLKDGDTVFTGVASNLAVVATLAAKRLHAPNLVHLAIASSVDPEPDRLVPSTSGPELSHRSVCRFTLAEIFDLCARRELDVAFLSGVQIDAVGRINLSRIPRPGRPDVVISGGAGAALLMPLVKSAVLWRTVHDRRTFVESCDLVTAQGKSGWVVTPLCLMRLTEEGLALYSVHPGVSFEEVQDNTAFSLNPTGSLTPEPTPKEVAAIREIDPGSTRDLGFARH